MPATALSVKKTGKRKRKNECHGVVWLISAVVFLADLLIKSYLRIHFAFQTIPVIPNIFHITIVFNTGAAFGILKEKTFLLTWISIVFIIIFLVFAKTEKKKNLLFFVSCGLIIGGACSNLYDRIILGYVVDYLDFSRLINWPVFNLSDSCITIGAFLLFLHSIKHNGKKVACPS